MQVLPVPVANVGWKPAKRKTLWREAGTTVADQIAQVLTGVSVKRVYGIVGDSLNGITDAIRRQGKLQWMHVRHEEVGAFAAGRTICRPILADCAINMAGFDLR